MKSSPHLFHPSRIAVVAMTLVAGTPRLASAADNVGTMPSYEVGAFGGAHFYEKRNGLGRSLDSPTGISPDHGGMLGFRLTYSFHRWLGAEVEAMLSPTQTRNGLTSITVIGYRAQGIVTFVQQGRIRPFAVLGYGALTSFPGDTTVVRGDTDSAFHGGVGAKFPITNHFGLRFDARISMPPAFASSIAKVGTETRFDGPDYEAHLTAYFSIDGSPPAFARTPDPAPAVSPPPVSPPPPPAPVAAPAPEKDSDNDGIPDSKDMCPNEPESMNGYQDDDGCPDTVPAAVQEFTGVIEGIQFDNNSAVITAASYAVLDKAARVLADYPDVRLQVSGHTDNVGSDTVNKRVSHQRADAVREYLIGRGTSADRITSVGYGPERPIAPNTTPEGRAKNRRTEFKLVGTKKQ